MQPVRRIALTFPPQNSDSKSLTTPSNQQLPADLVIQLGKLMQQTRDRFPNATIREGTAEMYLVEWEEMTARYGLPAFRDALSKSIRESDFFPDPKLIRTFCCESRATDGNRRRTLEYLAEMDSAKARYLAEREEDLLEAEKREAEKLLTAAK